ncbi:kinesin-like protein KIN12B-like [Sesbania bispinosa]|nr:kinesin-like protein KIN12B-like [Sesbania bispinosa]
MGVVAVLECSIMRLCGSCFVRVFVSAMVGPFPMISAIPPGKDSWRLKVRVCEDRRGRQEDGHSFASYFPICIIEKQITSVSRAERSFNLCLSTPSIIISGRKLNRSCLKRRKNMSLYGVLERKPQRETEGLSSREIGVTSLNYNRSRSHIIFTFVIVFV